MTYGEIMLKCYEELYAQGYRFDWEKMIDRTIKSLESICENVGGYFR